MSSCAKSQDPFALRRLLGMDAATALCCAQHDNFEAPKFVGVLAPAGACVMQTKAARHCLPEQVRE